MSETWMCWQRTWNVWPRAWRETSYCTVFLCMLILKLSFAKVKGYAHIYICVQGGTSNETCVRIYIRCDVIITSKENMKQLFSFLNLFGSGRWKNGHWYCKLLLLFFLPPRSVFLFKKTRLRNRSRFIFDLIWNEKVTFVSNVMLTWEYFVHSIIIALDLFMRLCCRTFEGW